MKVADTWVTIPEISLEREDDDMKIEVGKTYESIGEHKLVVEVLKLIPAGFTVEGEPLVRVKDRNLHLHTYTEEFFISNFVEFERNESTKPAHYDTTIDTIAFAKANFTPEQVEGFFRINAIKYLQRVKKGQVLEDLKKSRSYIDMLIEMEEGK